MRALFNSLAAFAVTALVGPVICLIALDPTSRVGEMSGLYSFTYDLIALLWPTWPLGVIEYHSGPIIAWLVSAGANVILFLILGGITAVFAHRSRIAFGAYALACALLLMLYAVYSILPLTPIGATALMTAASIYAVPFVMARRFAGHRR